MKIFRKGQPVESIVSPSCSIRSGYPVKPGTPGIIVGVRHGSNLRLVKFTNRSWAVQCSTDELKEVTTN